MFADQPDKDRFDAAIAAGKTEDQALQVGDNWIGAKPLGRVSTGNSYGVAVPEEYLQRHFGNDPANWRTARADLTYNGQTVRVPFVDIGPSPEKQAEGIITDITYPLSVGSDSRK